MGRVKQVKAGEQFGENHSKQELLSIVDKSSNKIQQEIQELPIYNDLPEVEKALRVTKKPCDWKRNFSATLAGHFAEK